MRQHTVTTQVLGPWSLTTSRMFWEGFTPAALPIHDGENSLRTVFLVEQSWRRAEAEVTQQGSSARVTVSGDADLDAAVTQTCRFLSLDVDGRGWPDVALRDQVIANAQRHLLGLRPCGFHSPYEAAAWAVLSQRIRITQAARLRDQLIDRHGEQGAFPSPHVLRHLDLDLPGRKTEYLHAVADAALDGLLNGAALRAVDPDDAISSVQEVKDHRTVRPRAQPRPGSRRLAALPHLGRRPPPRPPRTTHPRGRWAASNGVTSAQRAHPEPANVMTHSGRRVGRSVRTAQRRREPSRSVAAGKV